MKKYFLIVFASVALSTAVVHAQGSEKVVKVPDATMERVVRHIVNSHFSSMLGKRTVYFSEHLIKSEWLPKITNKNFVVLANVEAARNGKEFHIFYQVEAKGDGYEVWFGYGSGCNFTGDIWSFKMNSKKLLISRTNGGWGAGCGSGEGSGNGSSNCVGAPSN